jgi:hypothetical protein
MISIGNLAKEYMIREIKNHRNEDGRLDAESQLSGESVYKII